MTMHFKTRYRTIDGQVRAGETFAISDRDNYLAKMEELRLFAKGVADSDGVTVEAAMIPPEGLSLRERHGLCGWVTMATPPDEGPRPLPLLALSLIALIVSVLVLVLKLTI